MCGECDGSYWFWFQYELENEHAPNKSTDSTAAAALDVGARFHHWREIDIEAGQWSGEQTDGENMWE